MKKIRIAMVSNDLNINGISTVIMNYCKYIDRNMFDVTVIAGVPVAHEYEVELHEKSINVIILPERKKDALKYYIKLKTALKGGFDIVHVHGNSATITVELVVALLSGINIRIAHCHNCTCNNKKIHRILLPLFNLVYTTGFACSELAGKWLFGNKKFQIISNGFVTEDYKFDINARERIRKSLDLDNAYVIGHVGRFNNQKNHAYILDVFEQVASECHNAYLLLVGTGPNYNNVLQRINKHKYKERIILYGETSCVSELYGAFDIFVFPSKHEGLGIVMLEAQISGLYCLASDVVPRDVKIGQNVDFLPIDELSVNVWKNKILDQIGVLTVRENFYQENLEQISNYDIHSNVKNLEKIYMHEVRTQTRGGMR